MEKYIILYANKFLIAIFNPRKETESNELGKSETPPCCKESLDKTAYFIYHQACLSLRYIYI
ncbi:MAG: hypothetical protein VR69_04690 [Peptococcaceae bacterium BRH_c4b]|nr:MAG: hypothetical protein VR69_04690 [Peptococcaceae bacterium BRH_c4b]